MAAGGLIVAISLGSAATGAVADPAGATTGAAVAPGEREAPAPSIRAPPRFPRGGFGERFGGGSARAEGVVHAGVFRFDTETFFYTAARNTVGGMYGMLTGLEIWHGAADNGGFGLPVAAVVGVRAVAVRALIGAGANLLLVDQVRDDTGVGVIAPLALAEAGLDIYGITLLADVRVSRRWQIGAPDHTQAMFTLMVGVTIDARSTPRAF